VKLSNQITPSMSLVLRVFKDFTGKHTATSLKEGTMLSREGVWNILSRLNAVGYVQLVSVGSGRTSTKIVKLDLRNDTLIQYVVYALTIEAKKFARWKYTFEKASTYADFILLFGSILHSPKKANDIDVLIVAQKKNLGKLSQEIDEARGKLTKRVHNNVFTPDGFAVELGNPRSKYVDAIRKAAVLSGLNAYITAMKKLHEKDYDYA
jgi:hypothetical protein